MSYAIAGSSFCQSSFGAGHFEAVVFARYPHPDPQNHEHPLQLRHLWLETGRQDVTLWHLGKTISLAAVDAGCIIQSTFGWPAPGNFEVVVPERDGLWHYFRDNSNSTNDWIRTAIIAPAPVGPASMVQNRENGHLEVVVLRGREIHHHWRDDDGAWHHGGLVTTNATGPATLIQSTYWGNLELVVSEGSRLVHYFRDESESVMQWRAAAVITEHATGPAGFIQGSYGDQANPNFEVVVPEGDRLAHYFRDNTDGGVPWRPGGPVTHRAGPIQAASLIESSFDANLEVLSQENEFSIYHYYRYREGGGFRWFRGPCVRVDERDGPQVNRDKPMSTKVIQLTGEWDMQRHAFAPNRTTTQARILGTDLGASFLHRGVFYFLFGDTHWQDHIYPGALDSVARTSEWNASEGLRLEFHKAFPWVENPSIGDEQDHGYDVPLDGFSFENRMFVLFTADHYRERKVMGRSVLARAVDANPSFAHGAGPLRFQNLTQFSKHKFINVSVERVDAEMIRANGLPAEREGLLVWGTGAYRSDNMYLVFIPLDDPDLRALLRDSPGGFNLDRFSPRYFAGVSQSGSINWSWHEDDAAPLFYPAAIGELSVRWNPILKLWTCMYTNGPWDPIGAAIVMRVARRPWGPWSRRRLVLDWILDGRGVRRGPDGVRLPDGWFMHDPGEDGMGDTLPEPDINRPSGAYAPYQLPHHTERTRAGVVLYYVLSTWNPYQVVQMKHVMTFAELSDLMGKL